MNNKLVVILSSLMILFCLKINATHNRAGEITYRHLQGCEYEITIVTYTYSLSLADRPDLDVSWGDGTKSIIPRISKVQLPNDYYFHNIYKTTHIYPGPGVYKITMIDQNRNQGVLNIPQSVTVPFALETIIQVSCSDEWVNNSPILLYPPIDKAKVNELFIHNPLAVDPDGDSLSYKLAICLGDDANPILNYSFPYATNNLWVDEVSGDLIWDSPAQTGIFNIAMMVEEWRNGIKIGQILRDIQIEVFETTNKPPVINPINDICVEAGELIDFKVTATDPDNNNITLTANGFPFMVDTNKAVFNTATGWGTVSQNFIWQTHCSHVRKQPYHVLFRARDNHPEVSLVDLENCYITIVGPKPLNLELIPTSNSVNINWDASLCDNVTGYDVYRRFSPSGWTPAHCETGVPAYTGFTYIGSTHGLNSTFFLDNNNGQGLLQGFEYCYRVVARYPDGAESYASDEICTELVLGIPVITHVSVLETSLNNGEIYVQWAKPKDFDTIAAPGPYKYLIYRSEGFWGINLSLIDSLSDINDTIYFDSLINTQNKAWSYRVDFYNDEPNNRFLIGTPHIASSIFLSITPDDEKLILNFQKNVPWFNYNYDIYRQNKSTLEFNLIGSTTESPFINYNLVNGEEYCFYIKSYGHYTTGPFQKPLINLSQIVCEEPKDTIPPCQPPLKLSSDCAAMINKLIWTNPNNYCADDVVHYNIYFKTTLDGNFDLIGTNFGATDTTFNHQLGQNMSGCYYVSAVDSFLNESVFIHEYCIDECFRYELPNIFSPDGSGINDIFRPGPFYSVEKVDMKIFNRWGKLVFETDDPMINWDGTDKDSKRPLTEGVYYYICDVYEFRLTGLELRNLTGFINLVRLNYKNQSNE